MLASVGRCNDARAGGSHRDATLGARERDRKTAVIARTALISQISDKPKSDIHNAISGWAARFAVSTLAECRRVPESTDCTTDSTTSRLFEARKAIGHHRETYGLGAWTARRGPRQTVLS
jgi:hypothetical protein